MSWPSGDYFCDIYVYISLPIYPSPIGSVFLENSDWYRPDWYKDNVNPVLTIGSGPVCDPDWTNKVWGNVWSGLLEKYFPINLWEFPLVPASVFLWQ